MLSGYPRSHRRHNIAVFRPAVCSIRGNHCNTFVVVLGSWQCVEVCLYPGIVVGQWISQREQLNARHHPLCFLVTMYLPTIAARTALTEPEFRRALLPWWQTVRWRWRLGQCPFGLLVGVAFSPHPSLRLYCVAVVVEVEMSRCFQHPLSSLSGVATTLSIHP
jgi:hypothetical protein